jgi:hypothetical protein
MFFLCTCSSVLDSPPFFYRFAMFLGSLGFNTICTLFSVLIGLTCITTAFSFLTRLCIIFAFVPLVTAAPQTQPFPNLPFKVFSTFVEQPFGSNISLATMLLLLFTMTENPELLSLHARQQHSAEGENKTVASGWICSLSRTIMHQLKDDIKTVFRPGEYQSKQNHQVTKLSNTSHSSTDSSWNPWNPAGIQEFCRNLTESRNSGGIDRIPTRFLAYKYRKSTI